MAENAPDPADALTRTDETISEHALETFYDHDLEDGPLPDVIQTHDGEWHREGGLFRWWQHDDEDGGFYLPSVEMEPQP